MRSLVLILVWPEAVWRYLRDRPLPAVPLILRLVLPFSIACALALQLGLAAFDPDWSDKWDRVGTAPFGGASAPLLFTIWFGGTLGMAVVFTLIAPACKGRRDFTRSLNLAFFGMTPVWLASLGVFVLPAAALYPFALAWSGYLLFAGARILLDVGEEHSGEFLIGSAATMMLATSAWGLVVETFALGG